MSENHKLDTDTQVFFYEQDFYVLSNFSAFTLQWRGLRFDTSEAAYHWERFGPYSYVPARTELQEAIRLAPSAHEAFRIAQESKFRQVPDWDLAKVNIMREILREKASQHEYVRRKLAAPQIRVLNPLIEAYPGALSSDDLARAADYSTTSSGFANLKGSMRSLGFLDYPAPGQVRAADWLFPVEGRDG